MHWGLPKEADDRLIATALEILKEINPDDDDDDDFQEDEG